MSGLIKLIINFSFNSNKLQILDYLAKVEVASSNLVSRSIFFGFFSDSLVNPTAVRQHPQ